MALQGKFVAVSLQSVHFTGACVCHAKASHQEKAMPHVKKSEEKTTPFGINLLY